MIARNGVVVEADCAQPAQLNLRDERLCPAGVRVVAAARDDRGARSLGRFQESRVLSEQVGVIVRCHVSAAAPGLVADREVGDLPGAGVAVARPLGGQGGRLVGGEVLQPLRHLARRARTQIGVDVGVGTDELHELEEFVSAERVGFRHPSPVGVEGRRPRCARADAITPMVLIGEATAGPAHQRHVQVAQSRDDVVAEAMRIGDGRVLANPDAFVDSPAQVFRELAVDVAVDLRAGLIRVQDCSRGLLRMQGGHACANGNQHGGSAEQSRTHVQSPRDEALTRKPRASCLLSSRAALSAASHARHGLHRTNDKR